jgi:acyl carrier protein
LISEGLKRVILDQLGLDDWDLQPGTTAAEVPGWDSLSHASIIAAVEDAHGVRFTVREIVGMENVGQLQALLDRKKG